MKPDLITRTLAAAEWNPSITARGFSPSVMDVRADLPVCALVRDGERVGYLVYRVSGREYFVALITGDSRSCAGDLLGEFRAVIETHARSLGCSILRCTTERPAMFKLLTETYGWRINAAVLEKPL